MNQLQALKRHTTVVADTGDFLQIAQYQPRDATTNPSLILKSVLKPEYAPLLDDHLARHRSRSLDEVVDRLLVRFGTQILRTVPGRVSTEVDARLSFDTAATVERADARVRLISPFVGRIYDWHEARVGAHWDEAAMAGAHAPGVQLNLPELHHLTYGRRGGVPLRPQRGRDGHREAGRGHPPILRRRPTARRVDPVALTHRSTR